jgi:adenylate kinase family enzyme
MELVKIQLNSAACQNKGFILDGYPRSKANAEQIFLTTTEKAQPE